jgi:hypothetical protein
MSALRKSKTKKELESLVRARVRLLPISKLEVIADPAHGWAINVVGDPRFRVEFEERVEAIAAELRQKFSLAPDEGERNN